MQTLRELATSIPTRDGTAVPGCRAQLCRDGDEGLHYVRILDAGGDLLVVTAGYPEPKDAVAEAQRLREALAWLPLGDLLGSPDEDPPRSASERPPDPAVRG